MTFRIDPQPNQTVVFEFITGHKQVKVLLNMHFCKGAKRFRCTVSRDPNRKAIELDTLVAPVEINYTKSKRVSKFYAFINFPESCSLNISPKISVLADPITHSQLPIEEPSYKQADNDPTSKYYHTNLISEIEKLEITPYSANSSSVGNV